MVTTNQAENIYARIRSKLEDGLKLQCLRIRDDSEKHRGHSGYNAAGASHLHIKIVTDSFDGMSRIARYRKVYSLLDHELQSHIHALSLDLKTPAEFE